MVRFLAVFNYVSIVAGYSELFPGGSDQQNMPFFGLTQNAKAAVIAYLHP